MLTSRIKVRVREISPDRWKWVVFRISGKVVSYLDYGEASTKADANQAAANALLFWVQFGWEREQTPIQSEKDK